MAKSEKQKSSSFYFQELHKKKKTQKKLTNIQKRRGEEEKKNSIQENRRAFFLRSFDYGKCVFVGKKGLGFLIYVYNSLKDKSFRRFKSIDLEM